MTAVMECGQCRKPLGSNPKCGACLKYNEIYDPEPAVDAFGNPYEDTEYDDSDDGGVWDDE